MGLWYCFTVFTESSTLYAYETEYDVSSFGSLGLSLEPDQLVLLVADSVEHNIFVDYTPESVGTGMEELVWMEE